MKELDHPNVLKLYGVTFNQMDLYVILPYMPNGDLNNFIKNTENVRLLWLFLHNSNTYNRGFFDYVCHICVT